MYVFGYCNVLRKDLVGSPGQPMKCCRAWPITKRMNLSDSPGLYRLKQAPHLQWRHFSPKYWSRRFNSSLFAQRNHMLAAIGAILQPTHTYRMYTCVPSLHAQSVAGLPLFRVTPGTWRAARLRRVWRSYCPSRLLCRCNVRSV